jgi:membrane-anchored protein YejM (alkaline phosphatase superfamily)
MEVHKDDKGKVQEHYIKVIISWLVTTLLLKSMLYFDAYNFIMNGLK